MVFTRNQKRNLDTDENFQNITDSESINVPKRKKKYSSSDESYYKTSDSRSSSYSEGNKELDDTNTNSQIITSNFEESEESEESEEIEEIEETEETEETEEYNKMMLELNDETSENVETSEEIVEELEENKRGDESIIKSIIKQAIGKIIKPVKESIKKTGKRDEYDKFIEKIDTIHSGDFFERLAKEDKKKTLKEIASLEEIEKFNKELEELEKSYKEESPSVLDILRMNITTSEKKKLLEKLHYFTNSELLSGEYNNTLKYLLNSTKNQMDENMVELEKQIIMSSQLDDLTDNYKKKILKSEMSFESKVIAYKRVEVMDNYQDSDSSEHAKYKNWIDILLSVPFGKYINIQTIEDKKSEEIINYIKNVRNVLDKRLSFLEKPKDQIINIVTQMIRNPEFSINAIGLWGSKGTGKCLAKGTEILMYNGEVKKVEDINVGDFLMGDDSKPRQVLSLANGKEEMYNIKHNSHYENFYNKKNTNYVVNSSHILSLYVDCKKQLEHNKKENCFVVKWFNVDKYKLQSNYFYYLDKETEILVYEEAIEFFNSIVDTNVIDIPVKEYIKLPKNVKNFMYGYKVPIEFQENIIECDPYIFGLWLSDDIEITNSQVIQLVKNKKFIPNNFKINSKTNRLKLLAGLLDSKNGNYDSKKNCFYYYNEEIDVLNDIKFVCESLGFLVSIEKSKDALPEFGNYFLYLYGDKLHTIPCLRNTVKIANKNECLSLRSNIEVRSIGEGEYYGFEIDGNRRFVLANFIVTHNTSIVKSIAEALNRPYRSISLGGESDASLLTGHGFTYVGSSPGRIIEILRESKCMNPIVLIDELDKVSETHNGKEIIGNLIHLTDSTTNSKYNYDRYFSGIDFDLSKVLFIFTYNDPSKVDKILADRLFKIKVDNYSIKEKLEITNKHLISNILDQYNFNKDDIKFSDEAIEYIVNSSMSDEGMRDIKRKFEIIISRINTLLLTQKEPSIIRLKYKSLSDYYIQLPVCVLKEHVDIFLTDSASKDQEDSPPPMMYM